jgi:DNA-binding response OmpR family regulator
MKKKRKILICDDEVDLVSILKLHLEKQGYLVETAYDGVAGLKAVDEIKPDLMLLDINMPKMNGIEVYQRLTTSFGRTRIPVIIFTTREELGDMFKDIDADAFLPKPFEVNMLFAQIERVLNKETEPGVFLVDLKESPQVGDIRQALTKERFKVTQVEDLNALKEKAASGAPDFIVMEYMQKDLGGENFINSLKQDPELSKIPLVVYSYSGFDGLKDKALKLGADDYIGKPEKPQEIITAIRKLQIKTKENQL